MLRKLLKKDTISWRSRNVLRIFQHICIAIVMASLYYVHSGSSIVGSDGTVYLLHNEDSGYTFEDSAFFYDILQHQLENVAEFISSSTLLETEGQYDNEKVIDVTAFVNRNSILASDYITAVYKIEDLIKWSQNGFEYEERNFSGSESNSFLSDTTIYTHIMKNNAENGMNSFLNSQLENNTVRTKIKMATLGDGAGSHTILIPRYKTIYDEDIENIVSTWDGYNSLCANITEAASTISLQYDHYLNQKEAFNTINSNLRFYVTRTINAKTEVYTNIDELRNGTNGVDVEKYFKSFGRYIYLCPYDMQFDTNTRIDENTLRSIIGNYDYAFPDQMKFYIAVDTESLSAADDFNLANKTFAQYMPYYRQLYAVIIILSLVYFIIIIHIATYEGHIYYSDGSIGGVERIDVFPTELTAIVGLLSTAVFAYLFTYALNRLPAIKGNSAYESYLLALFVFLGDNGFSYGLYSIIRRAKAKNLYNTSLLKMFFTMLDKLTSKLSIRQNMLLRTIIPYAIAIGINIYLIMFQSMVGLIVGIILDIGIGIYVINGTKDKIILFDALKRIGEGEIDVHVNEKEFHGNNIYLARELNSIVHSVEEAVNRSMRDEKMKADLITNVSHDIKTPLTSIINYVDLLKRENIEDPRIRDYINILENKSQRLRQLTEDLVEASKISSGNITLHIEQINYAEIINQILGEFYEKFDDSNLYPILKCEKYAVMINADPRQLYRVIENLFNNVCKYALPNTRVYIDLEVLENSEGVYKAALSVKNISRNELNIKADELTERFIRGDISRSTEGSGLGLSIAKSLTQAMGGVFEIVLDGDLFKVTVTFNTTDFSKGNPSVEKQRESQF